MGPQPPPCRKDPDRLRSTTPDRLSVDELPRLSLPRCDCEELGPPRPPQPLDELP